MRGKLSGFILAALTLLPALTVSVPPAEATHTTPLHRFGVDEVPVVRYDDRECMATRLSRIPSEAPRSPSPGVVWSYISHEGATVAALCAGQADPAAKAAIEVLRKGIIAVNEAVRFLENQTQLRRDLYTPTNRTTFLFDDFEPGTRVGGYGDWSVLTLTGQNSDGSKAGFFPYDQPARYLDPDGGLRFFDPKTGRYPQGADVALVSPEIDLYAADAPGNEGGGNLCMPNGGDCIDYITGPRDVWRDTVASVGVFDSIGEFLVEPMLTAWEKQSVVTLSLRHRYNFASGKDGVRVEVFDHAPSAAEIRALFDTGSSLDPAALPQVALPNDMCSGNAPSHDALPTGCAPFFGGPQVPSGPVTGENIPIEGSRTPLSPPSIDYYSTTSAFSPRRGAQSCAVTPDNLVCPDAFTGSVYAKQRSGSTRVPEPNGVMNATFDLSQYVGESIWLVFHVRTTLDADFEDDSQFSSTADYGYFLDSVNVTAKAKMHNLRVKGTDAAGQLRTLDVASPDLVVATADGTGKEQTILPYVLADGTSWNGSRSISFYVTNFGRYTEDAYASVVVRETNAQGALLKRVNLHRVLEPGEVWTVEMPLPIADPATGRAEDGVPREGDRWWFRVNASLKDNEDPLPLSPNPGSAGPGGVQYNNSFLDGDYYQPRNETLTWRDNLAEVRVAARLVRSIAAVPFADGTLFQIDPPIDAKDKPRTVTARIVNVGNTAEEVTAIPTLRDDKDRRDFFTGDVEKELGVLAPGEERVLTWQLRPYVSGTYQLGFAFVSESSHPSFVLGATPSRTLYVGRTAGVVCGDDLAFRRECVPGWSLDADEDLKGKSLTAAWRSPTGAIWAVGGVGPHGKAEAFVRRDGVWVNLTDPASVEAPLSAGVALRAVFGFRDDLVYAVGDDNTILRYDGAWTAIPLDDSVAASGSILTFHGVWGPSPSRVFVVGDLGTVLQLNTTGSVRFEPAKNVTAVAAGLHAIAGVGSSAFAVGDAGTILRWDGRYWNRSNLTTGTPAVALRAVAIVDDRHVVAGGESATVLAYNRTNDRWFLNATTAGAGAVTSFARTPDQELYALGEDGLVMRCEGCLAPKGVGERWIALTSAAPLVPREDATPRLTNGSHASFPGNQLQAPENGAVDFHVTYADPEGRRPEYIRLALTHGTGPGATTTKYAMTWTNAGDHTTGAVYTVRRALSLGAYTYAFEASDGTHRTVTVPGPVSAPNVQGVVTAGGDCYTGADGAHSPAQAAYVFPNHGPVVCTGRLRLIVGTNELDRVDSFKIHMAAGQTVRAWLNATATVAVNFTLDLHSSPTSPIRATAPVGSPGGLTYAATTTGSHYLVAKADVVNLSQDYSLVVKIVPAPTASPLVPLASASSAVQDTSAKATIFGATSGPFGEDALAFVEGGYLLDYWNDGLFENYGDWEPDYHVEPSHTDAAGRPVAWYGGGRLHPEGGSLRAENTTLQAPPALASLTLRVRHYVHSAYGQTIRLENGQFEEDLPQIRLSFIVPPERRLAGGIGAEEHTGKVLPKSCMSYQVATSSSGTPTLPACATLHAAVKTIDEAHAYEGWQWESFPILENVKKHLILHPETRLGAIDFYVPRLLAQGTQPYRTTQWAIDEIVLEGVTTAGQRVEFVRWAGRDVKGAVRPYTIEPSALHPRLPDLPVEQFNAPWYLSSRPIYGFDAEPEATADGRSLWHLSNDTDAATWVANKPLATKGRYASLNGVRGVQSILVTPAVDLRQVFDPVLEFRHAFAGRADVPGSCLIAYDMGSVWVSAWDAAAHDGAGAWTRFQPLTPAGGYPERGANGARDSPACASGDNAYNGFRYGQGFFGRTVVPDARGVLSAVQRTSGYERVRVPLNQESPELDYFNDSAPSTSQPRYGGQIVRFAFIHNASRYNAGTERTTPLEGWYVTDLRVLAEEKLGNDLVLRNLTLNVGYDWARVGVGPGTTVPVNVTVENRGAYDVNGFKVQLAVTKILDAARGLTRVVARDEIRYDANIVPDESRNFTLAWPVAGLAAGDLTDEYVVTAVAVPLDRPDENDADNVQSVGDPFHPVVATVTRDVRALVGAEPRAESASVTRYLPVYVVNAGNVPVTGLTVSRTIADVAGGYRNTTTWTTTRPAPEGEITIISALAEDVDVTRDLYWTPPEPSSFLVTGLVTDPVGNRLTRSEILVESQETFLFDDFDRAAVGSAFRGAFRASGFLEDPLGGFGATTARRFGDATTGLYSVGADGVLALPTVDLSSASTAKLSFRHKYDFESGYDGGLVEASLDGGATWRTLTPLPSPGLPKGYPDVPISAGSSADPAHDPRRSARAFTGSSSAVAGNLDGWITSVVNLGQIEDIVRETAYERFDVQAQRSDIVKPCAFDGATCAGDRYYADGSWLVGSALEQRYWQLDNLTESRVRANDTQTGLIWSGSPRVDDDGKSARDLMLVVPVDLREISPGSTEKVELRFREWMRHDAQTAIAVPRGGSFGSVVELTGASATRGSTYRSHWGDGDFFLVSREGDWWTWAVDLSTLAGTEFDLHFIQRMTTATTRVGSVDSEWGWAIDSFDLYTYTESGGQRVRRQTLLDHEAAVDVARGHACRGYTAATPCIDTPTLPRETESAELESSQAGAAGPGRIVYLFGGVTNGTSTRLDTVVRYDTRTGDGETVARLPSARHSPAAIWDGTGAWIVGGSDASGNAIDEILRYSPGTGVTIKAELPAGLTRPALEFVGGALYVIGGRLQDGSPSTAVYRYREGEAAPVALSPLPAAIDPGAAVYDGAGSILVFGDRSGGNVMAIEVATGTTSVVGNLGGRVYGAFRHSDGLVYVFAQDTGPSSLFTFDVETHETSSLGDALITVRDRHMVRDSACGVVRFFGADPVVGDVAEYGPDGVPLRCAEIGRGWATVRELPSAPSAWSAIGLDAAADRKYIVNLRDSRGSKILPTGEEARIWWTGRMVPLVDTDGGGISVKERTDQTTMDAADSRLVTPAIDLSRVAGGSAALQFNHSYAFWRYASGAFDYADLGVVEVQVYDRARARWGEWTQLYKPLPENVEGGMGNFTLKGGYPKSIATTAESSGRPVWIETGLPSHYNVTRKTSYVYAYADRSDPAAPYGWVRDRFDLSPYVGERVRIGFRYLTVTAHQARGDAGNGAWDVTAFRANGQDNGPGSGGWFIDDVEVIGATLVGRPVELRLRAASDGSIGRGGWIVDDVALSGSTYERNVGLFLDPVPKGVAPGQNVTVSGALRNLADGVRRNLAVQIVDGTLNPVIPLNFTPLAVGGKGQAVWPADEEDPTAYLAGVNLGPRTAVPFAFRIAADEAMTADPTRPRRVILRVVEFNTAAGTFLPIRDNEVEGFSEIEVFLAVDRSPRGKVDDFRVVPAVATTGQPARLEFVVNNTGVMPIHIQTTCRVSRVDGYEAGDHVGSDHTIIEEPAVACTPIAPAPVIASGATSVVAYEFTPHRAGHYTVRFNGSLSDGESAAEPLYHNGSPAGQRVIERRVLVDVSPLFMREDFERPVAWTVGPADVLKCERDEQRARAGKASMRCGKTDSAFTASSASDNTYTDDIGSTDTGSTRTVTSAPFDLHNLTSGPVYLRFAHLPRLARYDGADVRIQILGNEFLDSSWRGRDCKIVPVGGYDGPVYSYFAPGAPNLQPDVNAAFPQPDGLGQHEFGWYASNDPNAPRQTAAVAAKRVFFTGFEEQWRIATFDLSKVLCDIGDVGKPRLVSPLGHTVRFVFTTHMGAADPAPDAPPGGAPFEKSLSNRGRGQGWFIDDVHISSFALEAHPGNGAFAVLDNATKVFPTLLVNPSDFPTRMRFRVDEIASSVPKGTVRADAGETVLAPGASRIANVTVSLPRDPGMLPLIYEAKLIAESLDDPNAVAERVIRLDFSPRRWPDLRVTIEKPGGTIQEGTKSYLPITIENYGLVTAPAPKIVVIEEAGGERKVHEIPAENLRAIPSYFEDPVESTLVTEFQWTPLPGRGARSLTVVVDPDGLLEEYTKADNVFRLDLEVSRLLQPDLALSEGKIALRVGGQTLIPKKDGDVLRYEVEANDLVTIEVAVENEGPVGATNVDVRSFIGPLSLPPKALPFVPAGSEALVPFTWLAQKGEWALQFTARTDLVELDDANNRVPRQGLVILTVKGFDVTATLAAPKRLIQPGESFVANLTLANGGIAGQELRLDVTTPAGWTAVLDQPIVFLAKGRTGDAALTVPVRVTAGAKAVAGEQPVVVRASALDNAAKRTDATAKVTIRPVYGLEVAPEPHSSAPGAIDLPLVLVNAGNSREPMRVDAKLPAGWSLRESPLRISVEPWATETKTVPIATVPGAAAGTYEATLTFTLPNGAVRTATVPIVVKEWRNLDFEVVSATPTGRQDRLQYEVRLVNSGNVRAPFDLLTPGVPAGWSVYAEPASANLAPGASLVATLTVQAPEDVAAGEYVIPLYAHFAGVQPATVEGLANLDRISIKIAKPDTLVREFGYTPRTNVEPFTRLNVRAAVENDGSMAARDVTVALFVDDVFMDGVVLPALAPGERREVSLNWTTLGGRHTLTVVVDPFKDLLETNRENNAVTRVVVVAGDQETVRGLPAQTVRTPGFEVGFAVLAAMGVALLSGRGRSWRLKK